MLNVSNYKHFYEKCRIVVAIGIEITISRAFEKKNEKNELENSLFDVLKFYNCMT